MPDQATQRPRGSTPRRAPQDMVELCTNCITVAHGPDGRVGGPRGNLGGVPQAAWDPGTPLQELPQLARGSRWAKPGVRTPSNTASSGVLSARRAGIWASGVFQKLQAEVLSQHPQ